MASAAGNPIGDQEGPRGVEDDWFDLIWFCLCFILLCFGFFDWLINHHDTMINDPGLFCGSGLNEKADADVLHPRLTEKTKKTSWWSGIPLGIPSWAKKTNDKRHKDWGFYLASQERRIRFYSLCRIRPLVSVLFFPRFVLCLFVLWSEMRPSCCIYHSWQKGDPGQRTLLSHAAIRSEKNKTKALVQ